MATTKRPFSTELEDWLSSKRPKTFGSLEQVFGEKGFAVIFLLLLFIPALPIPTGGVSHVTEVIAMLLALEMVIGRHTIWLPERWRHRPLGKTSLQKALPFMSRRIRWFERFSRPRFSDWLERPLARSLIGLTIFVLSLAAFLAPPFSGLDTLPALGGVIVALSVILEDIVLWVIGLVVGLTGIGVTIGVGTALAKLISQLIH